MKNEIAQIFWFESLQKPFISSIVFLSFFTVYFLYLRIGHIAILFNAAPTLKTWLNDTVIKLQKVQGTSNLTDFFVTPNFLYKCTEAKYS